jgi:hypothetical protein
MDRMNWNSRPPTARRGLSEGLASARRQAHGQGRGHRRHRHAARSRARSPATASASKATTRSRPTSWHRRWWASIRSVCMAAHGAVGAGAAGAPGRLRERHCHRASTSAFGAAGRAAGQAGIGRAHRDRRDPHLPRAVRTLLRRPHAQGGAGGGARADAEGNLYTGPEHRRTRRPSSRRRRSPAASSSRKVNELVDGKTTTLPRVDIPADWVELRREGAASRTSSSRCSRATRRRSARSRC